MRATWILAILTFYFVFLSGCNLVLARNQEDLTVGLTLNEAGAVDIGESLIHPASPLYFLKAIREQIELFLAQKSEIKAQRQLEFSQRRLREVNALVKKNRQDLVDSTLERYKFHLSEAQNLSNSSEELTAKIGEATARHLDILQRIYDQVGNPRAKQAIRAAIERNEEHIRKLMGKLSLVEQQKLIRQTAKRQALACLFLEREASGSGINDTERAYLKSKVADCRQNIKDNLKDELLEFRQIKNPQK